MNLNKDTWKRKGDDAVIQEYSDEISHNLLTSRQSYVKDFHLHNFYELFLLLEGELDFCVQQTFYHLTPGSLMMMNDLEIHKAINRTKTPYKRIYIHIPPSFFQKYTAKDLDLAACFTERNSGERNLIQLKEQELTYFRNQYTHISENEHYTLPGKELLLETYMLQLLIFVNNLFTHSSTHLICQYTTTIREIMNYMEEHLLETISLDSLADMFSLSKYYLCHTFKEETGTTIFNYLLLLRISKAKSLLCDGRNVTETCELSGFTNYSNFITTFKKHTGYTPKKYATLFRQKKMNNEG